VVQQVFYGQGDAPAKEGPHVLKTCFAFFEAAKKGA
jgi:hypothetical protein